MKQLIRIKEMAKKKKKNLGTSCSSKDLSEIYGLIWNLELGNVLTPGLSLFKRLVPKAIKIVK